MKKPSGTSYDSLYGLCRAFYSGVPDPRAPNASIKLPDYFLSAMAMFQLKYPSLLAFDKGRTKKEEVNLRQLFGINKVPSDTSMRQTLDEIPPSQLQPLFGQVLGEVEKSGKLKQYELLGGHLLAPMGGVEFFSSSQVSCDYCQQKRSRGKDKAVRYSHAMLGAVIVKPGAGEVLPLDCEPINKQDGQKKNDHELVAANRLWGRLWERHPNWKFLHGGDALFANGPMIREITQAGHSYILSVKPDSHEMLFAHYGHPGNKHAYQHHYQKVGDEEWHLSWCDNLPLNNSAADVRTNFLILKVTGKKGKTATFTWVTNIKINKRNVVLLARCGRGRWKIENETFNTLKNQGYNFEHNYGHGKKHLSNLLATLMMLVFLIDQIQQLASKVFKKVLSAVKTKTRLWDEFRAVFRFLGLNSFKHLLMALASNHSASGP